MAITILGARDWECGNAMINAADYYGSTPAASTTQHHTGAYSLRIGPSSDAWARIGIPSTPSDPSLSVWIYCADSIYTLNDRLRIFFDINSGHTVELRWNATTHTFDAYVNDGLVEAGTIEVSTQGWFHCQFYAVISDTGSLQVKIDGHLSIDYSGDTKPGATDAVNYVRLFAGYGSVYSAYFDDLVIGSGGYLGDLRPYEKRPASDDSVTWTPSTGADNYALEDETPASDVDYNEADTDAMADEFGLTALDLTGLTPVGVVPWSRAKMTDGVGDSLYVGIDSGGTDSDKLNALSTAWEYYWGNVDMVDPDDSAAWDQAKIDALLHRKVAVIP